MVLQWFCLGYNETQLFYNVSHTGTWNTKHWFCIVSHRDQNPSGYRNCRRARPNPLPESATTPKEAPSDWGIITFCPNTLHSMSMITSASRQRPSRLLCFSMRRLITLLNDCGNIASALHQHYVSGPHNSNISCSMNSVIALCTQNLTYRTNRVVLCWNQLHFSMITSALRQRFTRSLCQRPSQIQNMWHEFCHRSLHTETKFSNHHCAVFK